MAKKYFENKVPDKIFKKLNKDRKMNKYFRSNKVGKCVKIYDDYYRLCDGDINKQDWQQYYYNQVDRNNLIYAAQYIKLNHQVEWRIAGEYVHFRTVGQTWNGMQEEIDVIEQLQKYFPLLEFERSPYELDQDYFTDWQVFSGEDLMFGLQVKPHTYRLMNSVYQIKARENHSVQKEAYKRKYNVGHFMVYYKDHKIEEKQKLLNEIDTYLAYNIRIQ